MTTRLVKVTATGDVDTGKGSLRAVILTPAAALSTLDVRTEAGAGAVRMSLQAPASGASVVWSSGDSEAVWFAGLHATLAGAGASATFEYEKAS